MKLFLLTFQRLLSMSEWREVVIGDYIDLISGYAFKSANFLNEQIKNSLPVIKIKNVANGDTNLNDVVFHLYDNSLEKYVLRNGDILIAMTGNHPYAMTQVVGDVSRYKLDVNSLLNQRVGKLVAKYDTSLDFIYYLFKNEDVQNYLANQSSGSANQANISKADILGLILKIPPYSLQKAIASILSNLDDKIDLLHRQNATLEKIAETLFRQWFVEEVKEDWEEKIITELFEVRDGTHDSPKQKEYGNKLITSKHLNNNSIDFENAYYISEEDFFEINKRSKVETNDILFSMIGTIGLIYFEQSKEIDYAIKNIGLFKTSQNLHWCYYTFLWLKSNLGKEFIHENKSGSTQEYVALGSLRSIVFNIPPHKILQEFNLIIKPYFEKIKTNQTQIRTLTALRDILLPKLMSGEVRIAN
jgi:type I restriction enzyme, S subunit